MSGLDVQWKPSHGRLDARSSVGPSDDEHRRLADVRHGFPAVPGNRLKVEFISGRQSQVGGAKDVPENRFTGLVQEDFFKVDLMISKLNTFSVAAGGRDTDLGRLQSVIVSDYHGKLNSQPLLLRNFHR